jgi:hypothetical protein
MSSKENTADALSATPAGDSGVPTDKALTLKPERLAGSPACLNCGTSLQGPYCHFCGQPDRNFMRFFPALLRDLMEDFLDLDSRFARTMKPLLFRPGRLTRDFLEGRRFRYTPPLRLYIFSSLLFFLMAATFSTNAIRVDMDEHDDTPDFKVQIGSSTPVTDENLEALLEEVDKTGGAAITAENLENLLQEADKPRDPADDIHLEDVELDAIYFNEKPWDRETNPVNFPVLPDFANEWINDEVEQSPQKAREIEENPNLIVDKIFDVLPVTMFILLPVAALLFKFWYLFAKRYYIEHLILALHNHAYIFVSLIIVLIMGIFEDACTALEWNRAAEGFDWAAVAILLWIPLYFLVALKHVYGQGWPMTILKYSAIGISYMMLLGLVASVVALASFVML